jgi:hypothetical protein
VGEEIEPGLTLEAFGERVAAIARGRQPGTLVEFVPGDALALSVTTPDGTVHRTHLDNLWKSYKLITADGESFAAHVEAFLGAMDPAEDDPGLEHLVVTIRNAALIDELRAIPGDPSAPAAARTVVAWPFVADLALVLAFDLPRSVQLCMEEDLTRLSLTPEAARQKGIENVLARLSVERHGDGPLYMLTADGCYEASLLLASGLWKHLAQGVEGDLVVSVPCRDVLCYTGQDEPGGVEALAGLTARMVKNGDHPVSAVLLRLTQDGWAPLGIASMDDADAV